LGVLVHVQHPGKHDQAHGAAHGDRHEDAALAEPDVVELPRADEHHEVHDHHGGEDHGGEPQVHALHLMALPTAVVLTPAAGVVTVVVLLLRLAIVLAVHRHRCASSSCCYVLGCRAGSRGAAGALPVGTARPRSADGREELGAGGLAVPARLGADAAVLVHARVLLALITTRPAGGDAGLEVGPGDVGVVTGVAGQDPRRGRAAVGAVEVGPDALAQVRDHLLAQARVRARGARLRAGDEGLDDAGQQLSVEVDGCGVG